MEEETTEIPNKNLIDYLDFYASINNPQFAVLINGKWGSGKTFFIKEWVDKNNGIGEGNESKNESNSKILKQVKKWFANKRVRSQMCYKPLYRSRKVRIFNYYF